MTKICVLAAGKLSESMLTKDTDAEQIGLLMSGIRDVAAANSETQHPMRMHREAIN